MKKLLQVLAVTALPVLPLAAQTQQRGEATLWHPQHMAIGGYGGPTLQWGSLGGEGARFVGAEGGLVLNHRWMIGVSGYGTGPSNSFYGSTPASFDGIDVGYGSVNGGY